MKKNLSDKERKEKNEEIEFYDEDYLDPIITDQDVLDVFNSNDPNLKVSIEDDTIVLRNRKGDIITEDDLAEE